MRISDTVVLDDVAALAALKDVVDAKLDTAADTEHILHEVDAVLRSSKTVGTYVLTTEHPVLELFTFRKELAKLFAASGKSVTFIRSKHELCGTVIGLPFSEQLSQATNNIRSMPVTEDTRREITDLVKILFSRLQSQADQYTAEIDYSHISVSKHGRRISTDAVLYVNDTCRVIHACFGSDNYMFHILVGNRYFYEQPCLDYTFGIEQFQESVDNVIIETLEHFQTANLADDKKMLQKQPEEVTSMSNEASKVDVTADEDTAAQTASQAESQTQQTIELSPAEKTAAALHQLFSTKLKEADTVERPEEHYCLAEYFANIFNVACYRQFAAQAVDFVLYGVSFKPMPATIGISFLTTSRELAESDTISKLEVEAVAKNSRLFLGISPEAQVIEFAYRINGIASPIYKLQLTDDTSTVEMRDWVTKAVFAFVADLKLAYKPRE